MTTRDLPLPDRGARVSGPRSADVAAFGAGALAGLASVSVGELLAGLLDGAPSLVTAIGDLVIALQPPGAKDLVVSLFGQYDKPVLLLTIAAAALLVAAVAGVAARRRFGIAVVAFGMAGAVALAAALDDPLVDPLLALLTTLASVCLGLLALRILLVPTRPAWATPPPSETTMPDWDRRRFLRLGGGLAAVSLVAGAVGRSLLEARPGGAPPGTELPTAGERAPVPPAGASLDVAGITPIVVPNERFYRIDTALISPRLDAATWTLTVKGLVEREISLSYADLTAMPVIEQYVTIACVSNQVGGDLVGNALWTGVDLRSVLELAGPRPEASQIVGRSVDGFTAGFPTPWAMDRSRTPMIALGMNGEPLPVDHGYPARLIIPGLYGYVSATKWLSEIELTTWEAFDGYWVPLGWAKEAPILTQSRIDVPRRGARLAPGRQPVAGVAWAPDRGVSRVEVRVDDGAWLPAELSVPLSDAAWVQWRLTWDAPPGRHRLSVRATDGTGEVQTERVTSPAPDGARGHHTIEVDVA